MFQVTILGNVAQTAARKSNKNGKSFVVLPLAVTAQKDRTQYADAILNGKVGEVAEQYANVGRSVLVQGIPSLAPRKADNGEVYPNLSVRGDVVRLQDDKGGSRGIAQVTAIGRLVADPESGNTDNGVPRTRARLAVNFKVGETEKTEYVSVTAFGGLSGVLDYAEKGQKITVIGDFEARAFSKKDGSVGAELSVTSDKIVLMSKAGEGERQDDSQVFEPAVEDAPF